MDFVTRQTRGRMMASVRSKDTAIELGIRRRLFAHGLRYRLHVKDLPGKPDIVFSKYRAVVFINGCFWHNHDCAHGQIPATRSAWWKRKLDSNRKRDEKVKAELRDLDWRVLVIWECSLRFSGADRNLIQDTIALRTIRFLRSGKNLLEISGRKHRKSHRSGMGGG